MDDRQSFQTRVDWWGQLSLWCHKTNGSILAMWWRLLSELKLQVKVGGGVRIEEEGKEGREKTGIGEL